MATKAKKKATKKVAAKKAPAKPQRRAKKATPAMAGDDRKSLMLDTGAKLAGKVGSAKVTRRAIAQKIDVSDALVGHYLGTRDAMRTAIKARMRKLGIAEPAKDAAPAKKTAAKKTAPKKAGGKGKAASGGNARSAATSATVAEPQPFGRRATDKVAMRRRSTDVNPLPPPPLPPPPPAPVTVQ